MKGARLNVLMLAVFVLFGLYGQNLMADVIVGKCSRGDDVPQYATIQAAVDAATARDTVLICPGTYPEQVTITKVLTLKGLEDDEEEDRSRAIITSPAAGMIANSADGRVPPFPVAALIAVKQTSHVNIQNLTIDASNNGFSACTMLLAGIAYLASSGVVDHVEIKNVIHEITSCRTGSDFRVDGSSSSVTLQESSIRSYFAFGAVAVGTGAHVRFRENLVVGLGDASAISQGGIELAGGATGTVIGNRVTNNTKSDSSFQSTGIFSNGAHGVLIGDNDVRGNLFGISLQSVPGFDADNAVIAFNTVSTTGRDGIWVCSNNNVVQSNAVSNSGQSGVNLVGTCSTSTGNGNNNTVKHNYINNACAGVLVSPGTTGNTISDNAFRNVTHQILNGTSCP